MTTRKRHLDLTANPTPAERRRLIREDLVIAAIPVEGAGGGFHGIVIPQQPAADDQVMVGALICRHWHGTLAAALICANRLANEMKVEG